MLQGGLPLFTRELNYATKIAAAPFSAFSIATLGGNCPTQGSIIYQSIGGVSKCLAPVNGDFLKSNGAGADPTFAAAAGAGTVTSVAMTVPADETVSGSPITAAGTLAISRSSQSANMVLASPIGSAGIPTYRNVAGSDITAGSISPSKLFNPSAATFYGNPTNATATTSAFTIASLPADTTPNLTNDLILVYQASGNQLASMTPTQLQTAVGAGVSSVFGRTGNVVATAGDYNTGQVSTVNTAPATGQLGELIAINQTTPVSFSLSNTPANLFLVTLTAGNWDCDANIGFIPNGSVSTTQIAWLSTSASAILPTSPNAGAEISEAGSTSFIMPVGHLHLNAFAGGAVHMAGQTTFSSGTPQMIGAINCVRIF